MLTAVRGTLGCLAAATPRAAPVLKRAIPFKPFVSPGPFPWKRQITFVPSYMRIPVTVGGGDDPVRNFSSEEEITSQVASEAPPTSSHFIVQISPSDWKLTGDLLIYLTRNQFDTVEFPQSSLSGQSRWVEEILFCLCKGRKLNITAACSDYGKTGKIPVMREPTARQINTFSMRMSIRETRGKETVIEGIDLSNEMMRKVTAKMMASISHSSTLKISWS